MVSFRNASVGQMSSSDNRLECGLFDKLGRFVKHHHQIQRRGIRFVPALLPILQRIDVNSEHLGKLTLRQSVPRPHRDVYPGIGLTAAMGVHVHCDRVGGKRGDIRALGDPTDRQPRLGQPRTFGPAPWMSSLLNTALRPCGSTLNTASSSDNPSNRG